MSYVIVLQFGGVTETDYWKVNDALGIDRDFTTNVPHGLEVHTGGPAGDGGWLVTEVWSSKAVQEEWLGGRLGQALGEAGIPAPTQVLDSETVTCRIFA